MIDEEQYYDNKYYQRLYEGNMQDRWEYENPQTPVENKSDTVFQIVLMFLMLLIGGVGGFVIGVLTVGPR